MWECRCKHKEEMDKSRKWFKLDPDQCFNHQSSHTQYGVWTMRTIEGNVGRDGRKYKETLQPSLQPRTKAWSFYDFERSKNSIFLWKSHALRSVYQKSAKQEAVQSVLVVNDWAMKFLQMKYREKQSEWFAKRGLSWHISSVISKDQETQKAKVLSYAHLLDSCCQDWYADVSILENPF